MDKLEQKTFTSTASIKYTYYASAAQDGRPTALLLHGCPDTASMWSYVISAHLQPAGYGIIAPDLIGYGASDKPTELSHYGIQSICADVTGILDQESIDKAIVIGHDFGAFAASRMSSLHPERLCGLITLGTAYVAPSPYPFDFAKMRAMQEQAQGYCSSWYFKLFLSDDGAALIDAHLDRMFTALHGGGERMKALLCVEGGIERWLNGDASDVHGPDSKEDTAKASVKPYAQAPGFRDEWIGRLQRDGWRAPLNWYKALQANLSLEADQASFAKGNHVVKVPYLFVAALQDPLARPESVEVPIQYQMLPDVTKKAVDGSHWCMLEQPDDTGKAITEWLDEKFKAGQ